MPILNTALTLKDLPLPPPGKTGWPWMEQTQPLPERRPDGSDWPRLSIVTPNYNQGQFIEETIRSVLLQGYPNLEYIIIDGGSTDNSAEIIKNYEQYLAYWISEPDQGQSHGINKGFERCTGNYIAWMNSSDCYMPGALQSIFGNSKTDGCDFIYGVITYAGKSLNEKQIICTTGLKSFDLKYLLRFFYSIKYIIPSQSVFVSKNLVKKVGLLDEHLHFCMDLDWYVRIANLKPSTYKNQLPICFYRLHDDAKTASNDENFKKEPLTIAHRYAGNLTKIEQKKLYRLMHYSQIYREYKLGIREKNLTSLIKTALELPFESLTDSRYLGMLKSALITLKI